MNGESRPKAAPDVAEHDFTTRSLAANVAAELGWRAVVAIGPQRLYSGPCPACGATATLWDFRTGRPDNCWACWSCGCHGDLYDLHHRAELHRRVAA